jgi:hypothetical protein
MHGPMRGEANSPGEGRLEWAGTGRCKNLIRAALAGTHSGGRSGEVRRGSRETLWRQRIGASDRSGLPSAREEAGRSPGQGLRWIALERRNPWEAPVIVGSKTRAVARHFREVRSQKPRPVGPV